MLLADEGRPLFFVEVEGVGTTTDDEDEDDEVDVDDATTVPRALLSELITREGIGHPSE